MFTNQGLECQSAVNIKILIYLAEFRILDIWVILHSFMLSVLKLKTLRI